MKKQIVFYTVGSVLILIGMICIRMNFKKESTKDQMFRVNYVPIKNYGKPFLLIFGGLVLILGLLLISKA